MRELTTIADLHDITELIRLEHLNVNAEDFLAAAITARLNWTMKYERDSKAEAPLELREQPGLDRLELPVPTEPMKSWRGTVSPDAAIAFSSQQLQRFWSNPEFVRRRLARRVNVPFEM